MAKKTISQCDISRLSRITNRSLLAQVLCRLKDSETKAGDAFLLDYLSRDSGETWSSFLATGSEYFLDGQQGWRIAYGSVQKTFDGGQSWENGKTVIWENASFSFVDPWTGWAIVTIGDATALLMTQDGGKNWKEIKPIIGP